MRVTSKGQVTIPQAVRERLGITPESEVDFVEDKGRFYLVKRKAGRGGGKLIRRLRGSATVKLRTDEILALTRGE